MGMVVALSRGSTRQYWCPLFRRFGERAAPTLDEFAERCFGACRNDQWRHGFWQQRHYVPGRRGGKHDMGVCTAETKGIDPCVSPFTRSADRLRITYQSEV